jgi:multidrug efflux pump subunit AcrB
MQKASGKNGISLGGCFLLIAVLLAAGQSREFKSTSSSIYFTFLLALAFIYLVLAAQFESFKDPFIIMLTVPLSITGALLALWWSGGTLNIYSQVGLVTLIGLITKHGILSWSSPISSARRATRSARP